MSNPGLPTVEDTFGDVLHDQLDVKVNTSPQVKRGAMKFSTLYPVTLGGSDEEEESDFRYFIGGPLLDAIIDHSDGRLNKPYKDQNAAGAATLKFLQETPLLGQRLREAWEAKRYRSIRLLEILQPPTTHDQVTVVSRKFLANSFRAEYSGPAAHGLYEYLENNERLFYQDYASEPYYAKFCSIVQSSGTGKSRTLIELSKKNVVVLYMNLREKDDDTGFPCRDEIPSTILIERHNSKNDCTDVYCAFFGALFSVLESYLAKTPPGTNPVDHWTEAMCNMDPFSNARRMVFFSEVEARYNEYLERIRADSSVSSKVSDVEQTADNLGKLSLSESHEDTPLRVSLLLTAYEKLANRLNTIIIGRATLPRLVIAIDESHTLHKSQVTASPYRPADILTRLINAYSHTDPHCAIWAVFASTTSKVADFSPPNQPHNSLRVSIEGHQLFRPYTQLGWDQQAASLGTINAEDIAKVAHILTYGRPLWKSLMAAIGPKPLMNTASKKLCGGANAFNPERVEHVLAVVGQRFGLVVTFGHPESVNVLETAVASHLRICVGTTRDRNWKFTSYPSEPLLSCAAAILLHGNHRFPIKALQTLGDKIKEGMVNIGENGELTSRLIWLLAKDLFVRERFTHGHKGLIEPTNDGDKWQSELLDCKMILVTDWLEFVFGERAFGESEEERQRARNAFKGAYINFSHWISMDDLLPGTGNKLRLDDWTLRHFQRTSAVQCCFNQPRVDKVIPMFFKGDVTDSAPAAPEQMSQIFISDKDRKSSSEATLRAITRRQEVLGNYNPTRSMKLQVRPYIAILADLGLSNSTVSATFPVRDVRDPCLRIYAAGLNAQTYPFLTNHPKLLGELQEIALLRKNTENELWYGKHLDAQVRFGTTATADHMEWEKAKTIPKPPTPSQEQSVGSDEVEESDEYDEETGEVVETVDDEEQGNVELYG